MLIPKAKYKKITLDILQLRRDIRVDEGVRIDPRELEDKTLLSQRKSSPDNSTPTATTLLL